MNQGEVLKKQIQYYSYAIGAVLFLMFGKVIGNNGLAYLAVGMETIAIFMVFLGDIIADAYGKMLRYRRKRNQYYDIVAVKKRVTVFQVLVGILFFMLTFILADVIADKLFGMARAALIIRILAPVLLLRMIGSILIGYFQSFGAHMPIALTCLLRQVLFWVLGKLFCEKMLSYGEKVAALLKSEDYIGMYGAVGLAIAIGVTEVILLIALAIYYFINDRAYDRNRASGGLHKSEDLLDTIRNFSYLNMPGVVFGIMKRILVLVPFIVLLSHDTRGVYYGKYLAICSIPIFLIGARFYLLYARLVSAIRSRDSRMIRDYIQVGIQYAWVISILIAVLMAVLAPQITNAYFEKDVVLTKFLQFGSVMLVAIVMLAYLCLVHMAHNRRLECMLTLLGTSIIYVVLNKVMYYKMQNPEAVILAGCISLLIGVLVLGIITVLKYGLKLEYIPVFVLPLMCVGVMGIIVLLVAKSMTPHIGNTLGCIIGIILGVAIYVAALGLCRVFSELEIEKLYGRFGRKLLSVIFK